MSIQKDKKFISKIIQNYFKRFPIYESEDFTQDVWENLLFKEKKILISYKKNAKSIVPWKSYLARSVWNICVDLGKKKYAKERLLAENEYSIDNIHTQNMIQEDNKEAEQNADLLKRVEIALSSKRLKKNQHKIKLYLKLKSEEEILLKELKTIFPKASEDSLKDCWKKLNNAKTEREKYEIIEQISGKKADSEQRWLNYQIAKIREEIKN